MLPAGRENFKVVAAEGIVHQDPGLPLLCGCEKLVQKLHALPGAADKIDAQGLCLVGMGLDIAAAGGYNGGRVSLFGPADHLPGLLIADGGDGAGVDDIGVRRLLKIHQLVTLSRQLLLHGLGLVLVHLAA